MDSTILANQISKDLLKLGVNPGDILLVHSSFKSLGNSDLTPEIVIQVLLDTIGPAGTLLMPALSYKHVTFDDSYFHWKKTPSNVGVIPEYFRHRKGTIRSIHPTHSVCGIGKVAKKLLSDHYRDTTPCGPNSPFRKLKEYGGKILMLGCGLKPNTSMHGVEELTIPPYLFKKETITYQIQTPEKMYEKAYIVHDFQGWIQRYDRLEKLFTEKIINKGSILNSYSFLINTNPMWEHASEKLKKAPLYFVDRENI